MTPLRILAHISFWLVYLLLNATLTVVYNRIPYNESLLGEICVLPIKMGLTYFVFYYIIPLYLDRTKVGKLVGITLLAFVVTTLTYRLFMAYVYLPVFHERDIPLLYWPGILLTAFDLFITVAAATTVKMIRLNYKSREYEKQLEKEKLQSELNFLRAQTNPHFLFNTLNNLYVLAWKKSDKTADAIMMLSKILRFVLYECRAPRIRIADEAKVIEDYIELEKLRYNERLTLTYIQDIEDPEAPIAPLLLLPFVENSFKHGANTTAGNAHITINLVLNNKQLHFSVINTAESEEIPGGQQGIGLANVRRQLDLMYAGKHKLETRLENGHFYADLLLELEA
ncbi:MAG: histidine kinase [Saprospiraceae bacterium]|nr:histidine kinase [Saprospiraceae bacterium]